MISTQHHNINLFILKWKEGEKGKLTERPRESVCERQRVAENGVGVHHKKRPLEEGLTILGFLRILKWGLHFHAKLF